MKISRGTIALLAAAAAVALASSPSSSSASAEELGRTRTLRGARRLPPNGRRRGEVEGKGVGKGVGKAEEKENGGKGVGKVGAAEAADVAYLPAPEAAEVVDAEVAEAKPNGNGGGGGGGNAWGRDKEKGGTGGGSDAEGAAPPVPEAAEVVKDKPNGGGGGGGGGGGNAWGRDKEKGGTGGGGDAEGAAEAAGVGEVAGSRCHVDFDTGAFHTVPADNPGHSNHGDVLGPCSCPADPVDLCGEGAVSCEMNPNGAGGMCTYRGRPEAVVGGAEAAEAGVGGAEAAEAGVGSSSGGGGRGGKWGGGHRVGGGGASRPKTAAVSPEGASASPEVPDDNVCCVGHGGPNKDKHWTDADRPVGEPCPPGPKPGPCYMSYNEAAGTCQFCDGGACYLNKDDPGEVKYTCGKAPEVTGAGGDAPDGAGTESAAAAGSEFCCKGKGGPNKNKFWDSVAVDDSSMCMRPGKCDEYYKATEAGDGGSCRFCQGGLCYPSDEKDSNGRYTCGRKPDAAEVTAGAPAPAPAVTESYGDNGQGGNEDDQGDNDQGDNDQGDNDQQ